MATQFEDLDPFEDDSPDDAVEIACEGPEYVYARRIEHRDGRLIFGEEVALEYAHAPRNIEFRDHGNNRQRCQIDSFQHKVSTGNTREISKGDQLVIAWLPYTALRCKTLTFKGGVHRKGKQRRERFDRELARCNSCSEAKLRVESLEFDYWEQGKYLTATYLVTPEADNPNPRTNWKNGQRVRGLLPGGIDAERLLHVSKTVQDLLARTEDPKFLIKPGLGVNLHSSVREQADRWMGWAVKQALAGPNEPIGTNKPTPSGTPVEKLVAGRYRDLLIGEHKRITGVERRSGGSRQAFYEPERAIDQTTYQAWDEQQHNPAPDQDTDQDDCFVSPDQFYDDLGFH